MQDINVIIEIKDGALQAVYSNFPLDYVLIDHNNINPRKSLVLTVRQPDVINPELFALYDSDTRSGLKIREELKRLKF
jgi:hypothetical protein